MLSNMFQNHHAPGQQDSQLTAMLNVFLKQEGKLGAWDLDICGAKVILGLIWTLSETLHSITSSSRGKDISFPWNLDQQKV